MSGKMGLRNLIRRSFIEVINKLQAAGNSELGIYEFEYEFCMIHRVHLSSLIHPVAIFFSSLHMPNVGDLQQLCHSNETPLI